jgi:hypothetical protein
VRRKAERTVPRSARKAADRDGLKHRTIHLVDDGSTDLDDVLVTIEHPFGDVEVPLSAWMEAGPGPRSLVRPVRARSRSTGRRLPLSVIPLRFRNDGESRRAIRDGRIENPWPHAGT